MGADAQLRTRAVFLDRDGTLNVDTGYVASPDDVRLVPGAARGAAMLSAAGYRLVIVSNQSGLARGLLTAPQADAVDRRVLDLLAASGVRIDATYRCPHLPGGRVAEYARDCECRKPKPGLLVQAARERGLSLQDSWCIGDGVRDIQAGLAAGCRVVAVESVGPAHEGEQQSFPAEVPRVQTLVDAARLILAEAP